MSSSTGSIATHDGRFHCDEVFAVFLLRQLPKFRNHSVIRTRDPQVLATCDVVVDVGGVYDPKSCRFDHHQKGFDVTWSSFFGVKLWDVKFSSAGLVYAHYGKQALSSITDLPVESEQLQRIFVKIYESFVLEIDGTDNGISQSKSRLKYNIRTGLYMRVNRLNPWWNDTSKSSTSAFWEAYDLVSQEFLALVNYFTKCWWPAREFVVRAMANRESVDPSRAIILLESSCPWKCHLFDLEREERAETVVYPRPPHLSTYRDEPNYPPKILFVVLPSDNGTWVVQSVPSDQYETRLSLPESWRSLQDQELTEVTGIPGCIFVHTTGHLGANETKEGAIAMAKAVVRKLEHEQRAPVPKPTFSRGRGGKANRSFPKGRSH